MTFEEEFETIQRWQHTDGGKAELAIHGISIAADDLTDAIKSRDGARTARENIKVLVAAKRKIDDLIMDLGMFAIAAE